ncbi:MAG: hypothetical protein ACREBH_01230 [Candidatus Micrarchaeaceae archaeon]
MGSKINANGKLYSNKGRTVFVSSGANCPRINLTETGRNAKLRDDFSKGLKAPKSFAKLIFK